MTATDKRPTIHVLVPAYDCFEYLTKCLATVKAQDYNRMRVVVIDDNSPDERQRDMVEAVNRLPGWTGRVNRERQFCPRNIWDAVQLSDAEPDDVIYLLDGDDFLPDSTTISRVAAIYEDPDVWMSYGGYRSEPPDEGCHVPAPYPAHVIARGTYRQHHLQEFNHPICFRKFLWDASITESDLQFDDGTWFSGAYDQSISFDLLCRAGHHQRCLTDVLYVYRSDNSASDARIHRKEVMDASRVILSRPAKPPIEPVRLTQAQRREVARDETKTRTSRGSRPVRVRRV